MVVVVVGVSKTKFPKSKLCTYVWNFQPNPLVLIKIPKLFLPYYCFYHITVFTILLFLIMPVCIDYCRTILKYIKYFYGN